MIVVLRIGCVICLHRALVKRAVRRQYRASGHVIFENHAVSFPPWASENANGCARPLRTAKIKTITLAEMGRCHANCAGLQH